MKKIIFIFLLYGFLFSCGSKNNSNLKSGFFDFPAFFTEEIKTLSKLNPGLRKTIAIDGEPNTVSSDTADWNTELKVFFNIDLNPIISKEKYTIDLDSSAPLSILHYTAKDTTSEIQEVNITRKNGRIELIEAKLKTRSFIVDRDTRLSYQPMKGYGIQMKENYLWSQARETEIFAEIDGSGFLKK